MRDSVERVIVAACAVAIAIQSEPPATANHANRAAYAKLVLNDPKAALEDRVRHSFDPKIILNRGRIRRSVAP